MQNDVNYINEDWETPLSLPVSIVKTPAFNPILIPEGIEKYVKTISTDTQTRIEGITVATLQLTSLVLGYRSCIYAKKKSNWKEVAPMWSIISSRSGTRKTSIHKAVKYLISGINAQFNIENDQAEVNYEASLDNLRIQIEFAAAQVKKTPSNDSYRENLTALQASMRKIQKDKYIVKRLVTDDFTVEKLQEILVDSNTGTGIGIMRDELSGMFNAMSKQNHQNDVDFLLTAYNCTDDYTVDRIIRGTRRIKHLCVTVAGFIQPSTLENIVTDMTSKHSFNGLFSRFLLPLKLNRCGEYNEKNEIESDEISIADMKSKIEWMFNWTPEDDKCANLYRPSLLNHNEKILGFCFSSEAQKIFDTFDKEIENEVKKLDDELEYATNGKEDNWQANAILDHKSKSKTLVLKLCIVMHALKYASSHSLPPYIDEVTLLRAIAWSEYLFPHAVIVLYSPKSKVKTNPTKFDKVTDTAIALLKKIGEGKITNAMTAAAIKSKGWAGLSDKSEIDNALKLLMKYHWIDYSANQTPSNGGIISEKITINPNTPALLSDKQNYFTLTHHVNHPESDYLQTLQEYIDLINDGKITVDLATGNLVSIL
jgi:hypothetical protein